VADRCGDNAYGTGEVQVRLDRAGIESKCKTQPPVAASGRFAKDGFDIDWMTRSGARPPTPRRSSVTGTAPVPPRSARGARCPLRAQRTTARRADGQRQRPRGALAAAPERQQQPDWLADYGATRPKMERKFGHLMRRKHGGRRARVRGTTKIAADFALLAAAVNLARLAVLGMASTGSGCAAATG
jgi:hypothetical protein